MKIKRKIFLILLGLFVMSGSYSQSVLIKGRVQGEDAEKKISSLPGAIIIWENTNTGVSTDADGNFQVELSVTLPHKIIVKYIGFESDTLLIESATKPISIMLKPARNLKAVDITAKKQTTEMSTLKPRNTELITEGELLKAACCNLSESFETNPSVDVSYSDAVTGAKEIQLLGLSGIYTQMLAENIPTLRGLAVPYGLGYIPGPWMESIQISKGAGSVANGYEAVTGQINVEFKKPGKADPFFLNVFADDGGRVEVNTVNNFPLSKKLKYMLMLHGNYSGGKEDHNDDGFLDQPLSKQINMYNRLFYHSGKKLEGELGIKTLYEDRLGGQSKFNPDHDKGTTNAYGFGLTTKRLEAYTKTGLVYPATPHKSMGLQTSFTYHQQDAYFGLREYSGEQKSFYTNYAYISIIKSTTHRIKVGADYKWDNYNEKFNDSTFSRIESVPGAYGEYTYGGGENKFGLILGVREDYHNLYGWLFTPRMHVKYNFTPEFIVRLSGGRGYRTPNILADNLGLLASSKQLVILEKSQLEDAWNVGLNLTTHYKFFSREGSFAFDYYHTRFQNQLIVDQYSRNDAVLYYNLEGSSYANSLQATLTYELVKNLDVKLAYKIDDVTTDYKSVKAEAKPLLSHDKALINVAYKTKKEFYRFDATLQWDGTKPLPASSEHVHQANDDESSPSYFMLQSQVTRVFKKWELYIGAENILDYTQHHPIIGADNPFGSTFDATRVWGPIMGRKFFAGIRFSIK